MNILDNKDRLGSLLLIVFSLAYLKASFDIPLDPTNTDTLTSRTLPISLAVTSLICCLVQLLLPVASGTEKNIGSTLKGLQWRTTFMLIILMFLYALAFDLLGFMLAGMLFLFLGFIILGERRIILSITVSVGLVLFLWIILVQGFGLYLDKGSLYVMLFGVQ